MKSFRIILFGTGIVLLLLAFPGPASARTRLYVGIGTCFGHPVHHWGCHPSYRWHSGYYRWLDHDRYYWLDRGQYYGHYWPRPMWRSGTSIWVEDCWPVVYSHRRAGRYVVVEPRYRQYKPGYNPQTDKAFAKIRNKKSELLRTLKIGDKARAVCVDIRDVARLASIASDFDIIVNAAGPTSEVQLPAVQAAIEAGVHYSDLAAIGKYADIVSNDIL